MSEQNMEEQTITNLVEEPKTQKNNTILFALMNGSDNMESTQILAEVLQTKGYKIIFSVDKTSEELIDTTAGYEREVYDCDHGDLGLEFNTDLIETPEEMVKDFHQRVVDKKFEFIRKCEKFNEELIRRLKPGLIIIESLVCSPALTNSGIPWIWLNFGPPNLCKNDSRLPPGWSDLLFQTPSKFSAFKEEWNQLFEDLKHRMNKWCVAEGAPALPEIIFHPHSPYLNIYVQPNILEYKLTNTWELKNWMHFESVLKRKVVNRPSIPTELRSKPGKLVYLSMGKHAPLALMQRLTSILSDSKNKFIVSKGRFHSEYQLADNMWGLEDIPLEEVIQSVDLVLTCGDTKSIVQCFLNAKPLIVMPVFGDQFNNRARLRETGFGWGLDPFTCNKGTLICMIESTLDDHALGRRLYQIACSMTRSESAKQMANEIEKVFEQSC